MWVSVKEQMPQPRKLYWITDGKNLALGSWNMDDLWWNFEWHADVFHPTHFMLIDLPKLPTNDKPTE